RRIERLKKKASKLSMKKKKRQLLKQFDSTGKDSVNFFCLTCGESEKIPTEIVRYLDEADVASNPENPPQFECKQCGNKMYPEYYSNLLVVEIKISDVR